MNSTNVKVVVILHPEVILKALPEGFGILLLRDLHILFAFIFQEDNCLLGVLVLIALNLIQFLVSIIVWYAKNRLLIQALDHVGNIFLTC